MLFCVPLSGGPKPTGGPGAPHNRAEYSFEENRMALIILGKCLILHGVIVSTERWRSLEEEAGAEC